MSGFIGGSGNPISVTIGSLQDIGYTVDMDAAEDYVLPDLLELAESGRLVAHTAPINEGVMLPNIPIVLSDDSIP